MVTILERVFLAATPNTSIGASLAKTDYRLVASSTEGESSKLLE
jgi:hypothetical protein